MKPGPAISGGSQRSRQPRSLAMTCAAISRGGLPSVLAGAQRHVRLVVAELWFGGRPKLWVDAGDGLDPATQQCSKGRHRRRLFHCPVRGIPARHPVSVV